MKRTSLILSAGLLFLYLAHGSGNSTTLQPLCTTYSSDRAVACPAGSAHCKHAAPDASAALNAFEMLEPAEEQEVELSGRILHLVDTFARLVMVI